MLGVRVPDGEQSAGQLKARLTELFLGRESLAVKAEISLQMTPAGLSLLGIEQVIRPPAVGGHDPPKPGAEEFLEPIAATVLNDPEDRRPGGRGGPHRAVLPGQIPPGLIDVDRPRPQHLAPETLVRAGEQPRRALTDPVDRADRDPDPEQLPDKLAHVPPRDPIAGRQRHHRGLQGRPERRLAHDPKCRAGPLLTSPTPQPMGPVLDIEHRGLWQLGNLMAPRLVTRNLLTLSELPPAPRTIVWVVINDLPHLTLSKQPAPRAAMTRLPARLTVLAILAGQLLRFLARLRPTLLTRLGSILRRCLRTVARTRGRFLLQRPQPLLGPRLLIDHSHQERDTRLTPRVIDRLSLRPVHTSKIRRPPQRTLLWKTTTSERLRITWLTLGKTRLDAPRVPGSPANPAIATTLHKICAQFV